LVESELFGHRKGAFTGADTHRKGLFEVAAGGTLFLDEVGELDKSVQVKLLRFLESGEIRRVGENDPFRVDVRVLCATHRELREMIAEGSFREDLYFRINTFEIRLPPLRERKEDIAKLVEHLLARFGSRRAAGPAVISRPALEALVAQDWPGNVRELANVIERATILAGSSPIGPEHLPSPAPTRRGGLSIGATGAGSAVPAPHFGMYEGSLRDVEMRYIQLVLEKHNGNKPAASRELGISLKTLYNKINQLQQA
jgi:DNA-binding NtrC family response regulator